MLYMTLTGNNAITLRKLTSKVAAAKGIPYTPLNFVIILRGKGASTSSHSILETPAFSVDFLRLQ